LKIKTAFLEADFSPKDSDKDAAWDIYIELLTRITSQPIADDHGLEKMALESIYSLFGITRVIIKQNGRSCEEFAKIAIVILNQVIRPFTAKWHKLSEEGAFNDIQKCQEFRLELKELQSKLLNYSKMIASFIDIEDFSELEDVL